MKIQSCFAVAGMAIGAALPLAAFATQYTQVATQASGVTGGTIDATAHCPAGFVPTGGGYNFDPNNNNFTFFFANTWTKVGQNITSIGGTTKFLPKFVVVRSMSSGDGWAVAGFVNEDITITVYAQCASTY